MAYSLSSQGVLVEIPDHCTETYFTVVGVTPDGFRYSGTADTYPEAVTESKLMEAEWERMVGKASATRWPITFTLTEKRTADLFAPSGN